MCHAYSENQQVRVVKMKKRSLAGNCAVLTFVLTLICIFVAFCAPAWLVSDPRITGAKLDRLGLWSHCFRSLADPNDSAQRRFFVGCRWVYDPFTTDYDKIRGFLLPCKFKLEGCTYTPLYSNIEISLFCISQFCLHWLFTFWTLLLMYLQALFWIICSKLCVFVCIYLG